MLRKLIVCFVASAGAGLGTGFAGMSAASIIGPMLTAFVGIPAYQGIGIGLASDVLASSASAYTYKKNGNLDIKNAIILLVCVVSMTIVGSKVGHYMPENAMSGTQQVAMIIIGLKFLLKPVRTTKEQFDNISPLRRITKSVIGGLFVGFICGFVGAGGGMMMLFVLTSFLKYPMHIAVGTSVFIMVFTAFTGAMSHFFIGGIPDLICLVLCILFTLLWARIAAVLANKASAATLNRVVGVIMITTGVVIIVSQYILK